MNPSQLRVRAKTNHEVHRIHVRVVRHLVDGPLAEEVLQERISRHLEVHVEPLAVPLSRSHAVGRLHLSSAEREAPNVWEHRAFKGTSLHSNSR